MLARPTRRQVSSSAPLKSSASIRRSIATGNDSASARFERGATRQDAKAHYVDEIAHYVYAGDTALHIAAAAYQREIVQKLIDMGADVRARNSAVCGRICIRP